jgi:hypothetical protein
MVIPASLPHYFLAVNTVNVMPALFRCNPRHSVAEANITTHVSKFYL